jgi:hypothetical protein
MYLMQWFSWFGKRIREDTCADSPPEAAALVDDRFWHPLSQRSACAVSLSVQEVYQQAYEAYHSNPLAYAIIELTTSFVLGEGVTISAAQPEVQRLFESFWQQNRMEERVYSLCSELALYGEQFLHFFVNPYDGSVAVRQIDPALIDEIETDPDDLERHLRYHCRGSALDDGRWLSAGQDVLHFTVNKVSNALRGRSDLATLLPWLHHYSEWLRDRVRINRSKGAFLWDVKLTGADHRTLESRRMALGYAPDPGSVILHNEAEEWRAVEPKIQADDASADGRAIKLMIAAGASLPEHYLSDGNYGNRATASEMALPTLLKFKRRQRLLKFLLRCILDRVLVEAQKSGRLAAGVDTHYDVTFPEIDSGEHHTLAQAVSWLTPALETASSKGWISDETAMRVLFKFCGEEIDVHAEQRRIKQHDTTD